MDGFMRVYTEKFGSGFLLTLLHDNQRYNCGGAYDGKRRAGGNDFELCAVVNSAR